MNELQFLSELFFFLLNEVASSTMYHYFYELGLKHLPTPLAKAMQKDNKTQEGGKIPRFLLQRRYFSVTKALKDAEKSAFLFGFTRNPIER